MGYNGKVEKNTVKNNLKKIKKKTGRAEYVDVDGKGRIIKKPPTA